MFRSPEYCDRYEYIPIELDTPIMTPGAGVAQRKNGYQFTINDRSSYFDWFNGYFEVDFNKSLTAKLLQQGYRYHKFRKTFSKFYRRHYELVSKFNVGLKTLTVTCSCCPYLYFGSAIMLVTYFVNFR